MAEPSSSSTAPSRAAEEPIFNEDHWKILDEGTQVSRKKFFDHCVQHLEQSQHTICKNESIITEVRNLRHHPWKIFPNLECVFLTVAIIGWIILDF
jgi:hypothetical protein